MDRAENKDLRKGIVLIGGMEIPVRYKFVDEDTIECNADNGGYSFTTHYKSLKVET